MYLRFAFIFVSALLYSLNAFTQEQHYNVNVQFPSSVDVKQVSIVVDDGINATKIFPVYDHNTTRLTGNFFAKFLVVRFTCPLQDNWLSTKTFFIERSNASIVFTDSSSTDILKSFSTVNAIEVENLSGVSELNAFILKEKKEADSFLYKYGPAAIGDNDSLLEVSNVLEMKVIEKKMEFVKQNGSLYYSFWVFKDEMTGNPDTFPPDSLLAVFNSSFSNEIKESVEGQEVKRLLEGRMLKSNSPAPDFTAKTYDGKQIQLSDMRGKVVLLNFWASWCGPCLDKMPLIKQIRDTFPTEQLEIISISRDVDSAAFLKKVEMYNMNWLNVTADLEVSKRYGRRWLPDLYVIDRSGKIIYAGQVDDPVELIPFLAAEINKSSHASR